MLKIIICDDNTAWCSRASEILTGAAERAGVEAEIKTCFSPDSIPGCFDADPDVVFMDIEFDGPAEPAEGESAFNGIEAVKEINTRYPDCQVVYLTNYLNYVMDAYRTEHVWYLVKDQFEERLPEVLEKLIRNADDRRSLLVVREIDGTQTQIKCGSIRYIERRGRVTVIVTDSGEYSVRIRIPEVLEKLPEGDFGRCHTSFIVNLEKVVSIGDSSLRMDDGSEILISRGFSRAFRLGYMDWAGSRAVR